MGLLLACPLQYGYVKRGYHLWSLDVFAAVTGTPEAVNWVSPFLAIPLAYLAGRARHVANIRGAIIGSVAASTVGLLWVAGFAGVRLAKPVYPIRQLVQFSLHRYYLVVSPSVQEHLQGLAPRIRVWAANFTWERTATEQEAFYERVLADSRNR